MERLPIGLGQGDRVSVSFHCTTSLHGFLRKRMTISWCSEVEASQVADPLRAFQISGLLGLKCVLDGVDTKVSLGGGGMAVQSLKMLFCIPQRLTKHLFCPGDVAVPVELGMSKSSSGAVLMLVYHFQKEGQVPRTTLATIPFDYI
jgi:hypothetical protein